MDSDQKDDSTKGKKRSAAISQGQGAVDPLRKPVNTLAIVPQSKKITPLFRKSYNVMLYLAQEQGIEKDIYRAPLASVLSGLDFDSNDTALVKRHLRAMATTAVEWQSPTTGEGSNWAVSGLIGHAEIKRERGQNWLEWSYSVKLKQELLEPSVFARLSIGIISQLRSHGAIALYEICARYKEVGRSSRQHWSWWRPVLSGKPEDEKQKALEYRFFKRDVLKTAIAEVNAVTDIEVEMIEYKEGRFTSDLQFVIKKKAQTSLPLQHPPSPVDMSLVTRAKGLGIDDERGEALLYEFGDAAMRAGLDGLEKRIQSAYPEPLRDPYRYLKSLLPGEVARVGKKATEVAPGEATKPPREVQSKQIKLKRQSKWAEEWLRRKREEIISQIEAMSLDEQNALVTDLLMQMQLRNVHPSIQKRLQTSGWQHPMVLHEMIRFYAEGAIGEGWDKPTAEQLLEVAAEMRDIAD
ncbi:MAG: replication initiation protein [Burkholderiales bacterium]|nr:replication initiation protein [Burkholderiales bacterium]